MSDMEGMHSVGDGDGLAGLLSEDAEPLTCIICGTPLHYGGRGPKPKFCAEHRKNKTATSRPKNTRSDSALQISIAGIHRGAGFLVGMVDIFDGQTIAANADELAAKWVEASKSDPKLRKWLERIGSGGGKGDLIFAYTMVAYPILAHHKLLPSWMMAHEPTQVA